jgi:hypothetical protein
MKKLTALFTTVALGASLLGGAVVLAPVASASNSDCNFEAGELCDGTTKAIGRKPTPVICTENCDTPKARENDGTESYITTTTYGGSRYFWDDSVISTQAGMLNLTYQNMFVFNGCTAQRGFENAPMGGVAYTIRDGRWGVISVTHDYLTVNGTTTIVDSPPSIEWTSACWTYTTPKVEKVELAVTGDWVLNGPYNFNGQPMEADGGTLTRKNAAGQTTVQGDVTKGITKLGEEILSSKGLPRNDFEPLKTTAIASPAQAYAGIVNGDLKYRENGDPGMTGYGRYYIASQQWRNIADVYVHSTIYNPYLNKMFPAQLAENNVRFFPGNANLYPMWIEKVSGPVVRNAIARYSVHCAKNEDGGARTVVESKGINNPSNTKSLMNALPVMPTEVAQTPPGYTWGDNENTYTYQCDGGYDTLTRTRTGDIFQCDTYDVTQTMVRPTTQTWGVTGQRWQSSGYNRAVTQTQFRDRGADYINGQWVGRPCRAGEYDAGHNCARDYQTTVWVDTSGWVPEYGYVTTTGSCPAGWKTDSSTQCSTTKASTLIVEQKNAAPIEKVTPNWTTGSGENSLKVELSSHADPFQTVWRKPRINVNTGVDAGLNVNSLPASADVKWSRMWQLDGGSSPVLYENPITKKVTVQSMNDPQSPVHVFTDNTAASSTDEPGSTSKWLPLTDHGSSSASLSRWVGLEDKGWEESQRAAFFRFFQAQNAGTDGWKMTPKWKVTATIPVNVSKVDSVTVHGDGSITFSSEEVTENRRESYWCPGQTIHVETSRIAR